MCAVDSVMFDSVRPHGPWPARLLYPWGFSSKNTGMGCCALLKGILLTQGSNPHLSRLLHWQVGCGFFTTSATWEAHLWVCLTLSSFLLTDKVVMHQLNSNFLTSHVEDQTRCEEMPFWDFDRGQPAVLSNSPLLHGATFSLLQGSWKM